MVLAVSDPLTSKVTYCLLILSKLAEINFALVTSVSAPVEELTVYSMNAPRLIVVESIDSLNFKTMPCKFKGTLLVPGVGVMPRMYGGLYWPPSHFPVVPLNLLAISTKPASLVIEEKLLVCQEASLTEKPKPAPPAKLAVLDAEVEKPIMWPPAGRLPEIGTMPVLVIDGRSSTIYSL